MIFIGDNFVAKSYRVNFKNNMPINRSFIKQEFEFTAKCNSRFTGTNSNMVSRIQNATADAMNCSVYIPMYLLFVLDADLIDFLGFYNQGAPELVGEW